MAVNAAQTAANQVQAAIILEAIGDPIPEQVQRALTRFFPGQTSEFLELLHLRITQVGSIMPSVRIRHISSVPRHMTAMDPDAPFHSGSIVSGNPARAFPDASYIATYPSWYWANYRPLQPVILLHEGFHYYYAHMRVGHPANTPTINPRAYQGFIATLAGLPLGAPVTSQYPAVP